MPPLDAASTDWFGLDVADPVPQPLIPLPQVQANRDHDACLRSASEFYAAWDA